MVLAFKKMAEDEFTIFYCDQFLKMQMLYLNCQKFKLNFEFMNDFNLNFVRFVVKMVFKSQN